MESYNEYLQQVQQGTILSTEQFKTVLTEAGAFFKQESNVLALQGPINIFSNIYGDFEGLQELASLAGSFTSSNKFLFLGNIVDRGTKSVECLQYLLLQKLRFPQQVFIIRGNHECKQITEIYGFFTELSEKYGADDAGTLFNLCCEALFYSLPLAATVNGDVFCVHGGLSPHLSTLKDIEEIDRYREVPTSGLFTDLLWSDPLSDIPLIPKNLNIQELQQNQTEQQKQATKAAQKRIEEERNKPMKQGFSQSPRGAGILWNAEVTNTFCELNNFKFIIRGHQLVEEGYAWQHNDKVLTLFSIANYCNKCGNKAAFVKLNTLSEPSIVQSNLFRKLK